MADLALIVVANSVLRHLDQLSSPDLQEVLLLWNFNKDLKRVEQTIRTITDFLHDAEQRESKDHLVKGWLSRLRAILYDADDLFDALAARALRKRAMSGNAFKREVTLFFSKSNHLAFIVKTAHYIKDIKERLNDIKEDMLPFQFQCLKIEEKALVREETHSFVDVKTVIGRDEEKEDIISLLLSAETTCQMNLSVVSVIGFGGLGKTTLAQLVYSDDRVQTAFELRLWVCINYLSDLKSVLVAILTSVLKSTSRDLGLDQLQEKLRESIKGKKFLLVLDDVWDENASNWDKLKQLLVCGKSGSKVLATTRKTKVAQCLDAIKPYYSLNVLSEESALSLFLKLAFKDGELSSDSQLVLLGQQIVRKCGYVPLALITIGRMLRSKNKEKMLWLSFVDKELPEVLLDDNGNSSKLSVTLRSETHSFVDVKTVIGRDEEKEEIISLLLSVETTGQMNLSVVSIIGFGGLGKTTLAQLVYNDDRVQTGFDLRLWICINYLSDLKSVLVTILTSLLESKPQDLDLDQLQVKLRENIRGKKFLLVLDDVWDESASNWGKLEALLNCGKSGSMVLATTRKTEVAKCLDAMEPYYSLNVLSKESALSLFVKMAFKDGESSSDSELVRLGEEIVWRCRYVPLAIVTIGRMLCSKKKEKKSWLSFVDKELPKVLLDDNNGNDDLMQILKVSYNDLSSALKHCFAYCSLFPKDYRFDKDELVRMWIAQGFIEPRGKKSLEEIGDQCFFHMANRCFFQEVEEHGYRRYTCKMHALLHDLAIRVAGTESRCFIEEDLEGLVEGSALRHISVTCDPNFLFEQPILSGRLRTLLFHATQVTQQLKIDFLNPILADLRMLRTLKLSHLNINSLPDVFGQLIHLRYLNLSYNWNLETLPNSVCELHYLQTLKLEGCASLKALPSMFRKLVSLRHLFLESCNSLAYMPSGLEALTALVTLDRLIVHHQDGGLRYLNSLDNLCGAITVELPAQGWVNCVEDARKAFMSRKRMLSGMNICWIKSETGSAHGMIIEEAEAVLEALKPHDNLQYMSIDGYVGDALSSWVLNLSNVKELILTNCTLQYLDDSMVDSYTFPCLETLEMKSLTNLKGWWREVHPRDNDQMLRLPCLPRVSKVVIQNCPRLVESMPLFVGIENLHLLGVNVKLVEAFLPENGFCSASSPASSSHCGYDSKLKELQLYRVDGLSCLSSGRIEHLTALKTVSISGCNQLDWVSRSGLGHLTTLEFLSISDCGTVDLEDKDRQNVEDELGMPWKALGRLRDLTVPWQRHLQEGLKYLTALERLEISYSEITQVETDNEEIDGIGMWWKGLVKLGQLKVRFRDVMTSCFPRWIPYLRFLEDVEFCNCKELSLSWEILMINMKLRKLSFTKVEKVITVEEEGANPHSPRSSLEELHVSMTKEEEWLQNIPCKLFPSLRSLSLYTIPNLKSLPSGVQHLTSLQQLIIGDCSAKLKNRCTRNGADWPLISDIPDVDIRSSGCD